MRDSQLFLSLPRPPKLTFEALLRSSLGLQKAVLQKVSEPEDEVFTVQLGLKLWQNWTNTGFGKTVLAT